MTFIELMQKLEQMLGYHQWPVDRNARELRDVFDNSPVNGELAIRIMRIASSPFTGLLSNTSRSSRASGSTGH